MKTFNSKQNNLVFSGHETFAIRYEWLKKLFDAEEGIDTSPENLIVKFGVGKNMIRSMVYWAKMSGLFKKPVDKQIPIANKWGKLILGKKDPYLEKETTAWFVHWNIVFFGLATTPSWLFCSSNRRVFNIESIMDDIKLHYLPLLDGKKMPSDETIRRDIETYIKIYSHKQDDVKDSADHLLAGLKLISQANDGTNRYQMSYRKRHTLKPQLFYFALLEYRKVHCDDANTISMEKILFDKFSPGRIFQTNEESVFSYGEHIAKISKNKVSIDQSSGVYQWVFNFKEKDGIEKIEEQLLKEAYSDK